MLIVRFPVEPVAGGGYHRSMTLRGLYDQIQQDPKFKGSRFTERYDKELIDMEDEWYVMCRVFDPEEGDGKKKKRKPKHEKEIRRVK